MLVRKKSGEKQENVYIGAGGGLGSKEDGMLFCGVCHLSEQKCISMKIGMGAGLEFDWETNNVTYAQKFL